MTTSKASTLPIHSPLEQQPQLPLPRCLLKWRQGQLLVKPCQQSIQLPALDSAQLLAECLSHSSARLIRIDPGLGEASLKFWADACQQANKTLFLRLPSVHKSPNQRVNWWLRRVIEWLCAAILLLCLSPLMLGLLLLMRRRALAPIRQRWCVGERGRLFRLLEFRLENSDTTPLRRWLRQYMRKLPQLFNVLRGEMNLFGPHPRTLHDAVRMSPPEQRQLNILPGVVDLRREMVSKLLDADAVRHWELK